MKGRIRSATRATVALLSTAAWLAISNHCVIAAQLSAPETLRPAESHCPAHPAPEPAKHQQQPGVECCKTLSATGALVKLELGYKNGDFIPYRYSSARLCHATSMRPLPSYELDTGPPRSVSFAESVLQRSLLAHAPPRLS